MRIKIWKNVKVQLSLESLDDYSVYLSIIPHYRKSKSKSQVMQSQVWSKQQKAGSNFIDLLEFPIHFSVRNKMCMIK